MSRGVVSSEVVAGRSRWTLTPVSVVAVAICAIALGGCAYQPVTEAAAKSSAKSARPVVRTVSRTPIPLPDRALLQRQAEPDCAFRGPVSSPVTAEETRQKLDYEQQCYRQAETNVRGRLDTLQDAVSDTIKAVERR